MKEVYKTLKQAEKAFDVWTQEDIVFLIFDKENRVYRLVNEERLDFLENEFDLDFTMIYETW
tara:strand:- start:990 stop:1175 length:186 start_codon:yes stop_codon:yes gene_type:complete